MCGEVEERVNQGKGVVEKGAPGVFVTATISVDPGITRMIEQAGLAIRIQIPFWLSPWVMARHPYREWADMIGVGPCLDIPHSCEAHVAINVAELQGFQRGWSNRFLPLLLPRVGAHRHDNQEDHRERAGHTGAGPGGGLLRHPELQCRPAKDESRNICGTAEGSQSGIREMTKALRAAKAAKAA